MTGRFRKKLVEVEAVQWTGENRREVEAFAGANLVFSDDGRGIRMWCGIANPGDYIYRDFDGSRRCSPPASFEATYEPAPSPQPNNEQRYREELQSLLALSQEGKNDAEGAMGTATPERYLGKAEVFDLLARRIERVLFSDEAVAPTGREQRYREALKEYAGLFGPIGDRARDALKEETQ